MNRQTDRYRDVKRKRRKKKMNNKEKK